MKLKSFLAALLSVFCISGIAFAQAGPPPEHEEVTLTTYYPAPYGDYDAMTSNTVRLNPRNTRPSPTAEGLLYYDDGTGPNPEGVTVYDGANWNLIGGAGAGLWQQNGTDIFYNAGDVGIGINNPSANLDVAGTAEINGILNMTNHRITNVATPVANQDAANKAYVDAQAGGGASYTRKCGWGSYGTNWPSDLFGSCTPPACAAGYTSQGVDCYPTALHSTHVMGGTGRPILFSSAGVCERVCTD